MGTSIFLLLLSSFDLIHVRSVEVVTFSVVTAVVALVPDVDVTALPAAVTDVAAAEATGASTTASAAASAVPPASMTGCPAFSAG